MGWGTRTHPQHTRAQVPKIDKATMQRKQKESANAFDVRYTAVQARAEEIYRSLGPMQSLTVRKVAKSKEEHDEAMELVALA